MRLRFGAFGPLQIRAERVELKLPKPVRLLYASDLHLGHFWTASVPNQLIAAAEATVPDQILLGGDLMDRARARGELERLIAALISIAPVAAVPGNHDVAVGVAIVRRAVVGAGGIWLPEQSIDCGVRIEGRIAAASNRPRIFCAHDPAEFPTAVAAGFDLVLSGHLHGGQFVFANSGGRQYPAVWFYRWHQLRFVSGDSHLLVSRGAADTFPLRFNCAREVILCHLY